MLIVVVNVITAVASIGFATVAMITPATLAGSATVASTCYYAAMFATRAIPIAVAVVAVLTTAASRDTVIVVLAVAGAAQVGDLVIGLLKRISGMTAGAAIAAIVHFASVIHLVIAG